MAEDRTKHPFLKAIDAASTIFIWSELCNGFYVEVGRPQMWQVMNVCLLRGCSFDDITYRVDGESLYIDGPSLMAETPNEETRQMEEPVEANG